MMYKYFFLMRPPMPGAMPREGLESAHEEYGVAPSGHHYWGWALYTRKLTDEEVRSYELEPDYHFDYETTSETPQNDTF